MNAWVCFKHFLRVSRAQGQGSSNTLREEFMHDWIRFSKVAEALQFPECSFMHTFTCNSFLHVPKEFKKLLWLAPRRVSLAPRRVLQIAAI